MTAPAEAADQGSGVPPEAVLSRAHFYAIMGVLFLAEAFASIENHMVLTALPAILREFPGSSVFVWLIAVYGLVQAATAAIGARLGDIYGRRRLLAIVVTIASLGSLLSAVGSSVETIAVGRALQGFTGAILPLGYGITRQIAPKGRAAVWIGILTGGYAFSAGFGYLMGGILADLGSWRTLFSFTAVFGAILVPAILLTIPVLRGFAPGGKLDWIGGLLFVPGVASLLFGISQGQDAGWGAMQCWGPIAAGALILAIWAIYESRHPEPLINVRLFRQPQIVLGNLCALLAGASMGQLALVMMLLLQQKPVAALGVGLGVSATMAGLLKLPSNVSALLGAPYSGWLAARYGARWGIFQGSLMGAIAWTLLIFFHDSVWEVLVLSIFGSMGMTMILAGLPNLVLEGAPMERSSEVTGLTQVIRGAASGIGAMVVGMILFRGNVPAPHGGHVLYTKAAYQEAMVYVVVMATLVALLCFFFKRRSAAPAQGRTRPAGVVRRPSLVSSTKEPL